MIIQLSVVFKGLLKRFETCIHLALPPENFVHSLMELVETVIGKVEGLREIRGSSTVAWRIVD